MGNSNENATFDTFSGGLRVAYFYPENKIFVGTGVCFGTNYSTTEYEHDISPFYWKSTYYKQGLFVDSTPEYGVRTVGFHILLYINIIPNQHVRSPVTLNVTSGVVNALGE